jgi:hypothetical protein
MRGFFPFNKLGVRMTMRDVVASPMAEEDALLPRSKNADLVGALG